MNPDDKVAAQAVRRRKMLTLMELRRAKERVKELERTLRRECALSIAAQESAAPVPRFLRVGTEPA